MAKHRGRGFATIEYPTGMNQNGDPSQAWIKLKPDGRVDVFSGTVDIGQGSKTVHTQIVADTLGVPYDWVTMDNSNTDSSAVCTGTFASRGTFIGGNAVRLAAERVRERILDIASKELEIDPADLEIDDGEVVAKGAPQKKIGVADVAGAATYNYGELISGSSTALKPYADVDDATGQVEIEPHSAISYAACVAEVEVDDETGEVVVEKLVQVYDVGRAINPTLVEGQIEGGAIMGLGLGLLESSYPYYPSVEHRGGEFGAYLGPALQDLPELDNVILENPSADGPFGAKAIGEMANNAQPPAIANAIYDAVGVWVTEMPATPERVLEALEAEARAAPRGQARRSSTSDLSVQHGLVERRRRASSASMPETASRPFRTWNGRDACEFLDGVRLHAIGGEQVLLCRVAYEPGKQVPWHAHEHTEQVMFILERRGRDDDRGRDEDAGRRRRRRRQPRPAAQAVLGGRRHVHGGARAGAARPRAGPRARPRARRRTAARRTWRAEMPLVRVELFERRLTPELESRLIERLTETLLEALEAPELKEHTWVIVEGHDAHRWGRDGKPWDEADG